MKRFYSNFKLYIFSYRSTKDVYGNITFGVGVAPLYSILAIWIDSLLSCCLLNVNVEKKIIQSDKLSYIHVHFGKMMLFCIISIIQSTIILLGYIFILKISPVSFWIALLFILTTSITFTIIIYTLVSIFGNIGKAIAVVMMVSQIAGSGGLYPVETNPVIFRKLAPLWPFKYAMAGFREVISGPIKDIVISNLKSLSIFIIVFLIMIFIKTSVSKSTSIFDKELNKLGL